MVETDKYIFFYTNWMSNWHRTKIVEPRLNISFNNSEQLYMFYKADFFKDASTCGLLLNPNLHPKDAKELGGQVANYKDELWDTVRFGFMTLANYLKFSQNPELRAKLLATSGKILVEASSVDRIWGIGLAEQEPLEILTDEGNWRGQNLLGKAIMRVRAAI